jgi:CheY-like chemotaxis protein
MDPVIRTVLIVEDNDVTREGLAVILTHHGYAAVTASDGREALDMIRRGLQPAIILLDMLLPEKDGWAFIKDLRNTTLVDTPVAIVTGLPVSSSEWSQGLGAVALLRKPIETEQLLREVSRYCSTQS